jgi:ubiquinone/menaquinone biosynthesis C-methylase UbiE
MTMAKIDQPENLKDMPPSRDMPPSMVLMQMATGKWVSQAIYVAAKLGIADLLEQEPKSCEDLAASTQTDPEALYRVLRALASVGVFSEVADRRFCLTPIAECLRTGAPGSLRALATMCGERWSWDMWGKILYSVKTGKPSFDHVHKMRPFEFLARNPEDGRLFDQAMAVFSTAENAAVIAAFDFSQFKKIVDVGAGHGRLLLSMLKASSQLEAILFDLAPVIEGARALINEAGIAERCNLISGDFFESIPPGGDAYLLKHIIHDWDDANAIKILTNCRRAMGKNARLLVIEMVIPPGNAPFPGKFLDLEMLLIGGRERMEAEYQAMFNSAGFNLTRIIPTQSPVSVIEGTPA